MSPVEVEKNFLVAVKPAGLLAVPGRGDSGRDCLLTRLQVHWPDVEVVHRLDMATSGLMVFARGKAAQRELSIAFAQRRVSKGYVAVVQGQLLSGEAGGRIDLALAADWPNRPRQKVDSVAGKPSLTHYRTIAYDPAQDTTRLALEPVTGRSHQLRVHLMAIGHPIVGDALYGAAAQASRLLLHASALAFDDPDSGTRLQFVSEAPF
ncbi:RluA family pseudouridine synthase [Ideonella sp. BN130291]|uniref:RluA family pseudouridine synthase n=1 Tax=Ideonella sp. BN130291 TaxID=3112940 RepID=UPI002E272815|nr:RluA family pseudouridine synthase [Ideonella sp. BN130291]